MNISVTPNNGYTFDKCTLSGGGVTNNSEFTNTSFHITKSNKKQILNFVFKADTLDTILTSIPTEGGKVTMEQIIKWNPDIIILSNFDKILPEDIYNNKFEGQDW